MRVLLLIILFSFLLLSGCMQIPGDTLDQRPIPVFALTSISPADGATAILVTDNKITLSFSYGVEQESLWGNDWGTTCIGTFQVSSDNFLTCLRLASKYPSFSHDSKSAEFILYANLSSSTTYKIKVSTDVKKSEGGDALSAEYLSSTGFVSEDKTPPTVVAFFPSSGATSVDVNTSIAVTFDEAILPYSVQANTSSTACLGTIQISKDNFLTCIKWAGTPSASSDFKTYTVIPASSLDSDTTYKARVLSHVLDNNLNPMDANYTTTSGFTTKDIISPTLVSVTPLNAATAVSETSSVKLTFSEAMDTSTITVNTVDTTCTGTVQLSSNNFVTCVQFGAVPVFSSGDTVATMTPIASLTSDTTYKVKVISTITDIAGNAVLDYTMSTGFTVKDWTPPIFLSIVPENTATGISQGTSVSLTFNEAIDQNSVTLNTTNTVCSGAIQISSNGFSSCLIMNSTVAMSNLNRTVTVTPSSGYVSESTYQVKVLDTVLTDLAGNFLSLAYTTPFGFTTKDFQPPSVSAVTPIDGATGVAQGTAIAVTFDEVMNVASITTNSANTSCSGTIQVSKNANFTSCVQMAGPPVASGGDTIFTVTPAGDYDSMTTYKVRVTTGAKDDVLNSLATTYTMATGFTMADFVPPTVVSYTPSDGAAPVDPLTSISVTFSEPLNPLTVTTNTADTTCSGTFQVSDDNFVTCVQMTAAPVVSNSDQTYTVTPLAKLTSNTTYVVRITTGVQDVAANSPAADIDMISGFRTYKAYLQLTWAANKESLVNSAGGGYKLCYSQTPNFVIDVVACKDVPYVSGPTAPTSTTLLLDTSGTWYFKVRAYSVINSGSSGSGGVSIVVP